MLPIGKGAVTTYPCDPRIPVRLLPPDSMKQSTTLTFLGFFGPDQRAFRRLLDSFDDG